MFDRLPWNLRLLNLQPLRRRERLSQAFFLISDHVCEANLARCIFDKLHDIRDNIVPVMLSIPGGGDTLESSILNNTSVHVEKAKPVLGGSASSFSQVTVATPLVPPTAAAQAAAIQAAADLPTPKEIFTRTC